MRKQLITRDIVAVKARDGKTFYVNAYRARVLENCSEEDMYL